MVVFWLFSSIFRRFEATQDEIRSAYKRRSLCQNLEQRGNVSPRTLELCCLLRRDPRVPSRCESVRRCSRQVVEDMLETTFMETYGNYAEELCWRWCGEMRHTVTHCASVRQVHPSAGGISLAQRPATAWGLRLEPEHGAKTRDDV